MWKYVFAMALMLLAGSASAGDVAVKGRMFGPDGKGRGLITISSSSLSIKAKRLFRTVEITYKFGELEKMRFQTGLMGGKITLTTTDGDYIYLKMKNANAKIAKKALKSHF